MIYFLATPQNQNTMRVYLDTWGASLDSRVRILTYDALTTTTTFPVGTYVFADLELLTPYQTERASQLRYHLSLAGLPVLNHPHETLRRYDLLRLLFERNANEFDVYRLSETRRPRRFPVFLRPENGHRIVSRLVDTQEDLKKAIRQARRKGYAPDQLLMVEFCDTSDAAGVFRTYSAFMVKDRVIPRLLLFSQKWLRRKPDLVDEEHMQEEWEYLTTNPHETWIRRMFRLANVQYGKIDYGMLGGKPQVWEINTNPMLLWPPSMYQGEQLPGQRFFAGRIEEALKAIDCTPSLGRGFSVVVPPTWCMQRALLEAASPRTSISARIM